MMRSLMFMSRKRPDVTVAPAMTPQRMPSIGMMHTKEIGMKMVIA